jgi:hypothetical protein
MIIFEPVFLEKAMNSTFNSIATLSHETDISFKSLYAIKNGRPTNEKKARKILKVLNIDPKEALIRGYIRYSNS